MIILLFCISLGLAILFAILYDKNYVVGDWADALSVVSGFISIISFITIIALTVKCSNLKKIDDIIMMYQEENELIEVKMDDLVKGYMDYEKTTFTEFAPESSITLVSLYPELKSDELVQRQIDVYMNNNQKIKNLKEKKIYSSVYRWWLYFGK